MSFLRIAGEGPKSYHFSTYDESGQPTTPLQAMSINLAVDAAGALVVSGFTYGARSGAQPITAIAFGWPDAVRKSELPPPINTDRVCDRTVMLCLDNPKRPDELESGYALRIKQLYGYYFNNEVPSA